MKNRLYFVSKHEVVKKANQLLIIEADATLEPLLSQFNSIFQSLSDTPVIVEPLLNVANALIDSSPQLVLLHSNLTTMQHLQQFVHLLTLLPFSNFIIVSNEQDEELCLMALEAGAGDSIKKEHLSLYYLRKATLLSRRKNRVQKELNQNREQLLACIQNTPNVAVQWYNSKAEVLFWNETSERIFGWTAEEAVGKTVDQLIVIPENKEFWVHRINELSKTGTRYQTEEWSFSYRDGREGCCISTLFPIPSFGTEPWFVCMDVEITDRKQMEKALRKSEEGYRTLFNQASDAIFINDDKGRLLDMNEMACQLSGYTKEQLVEMNITDLYGSEELAARPIMWEELLAGRRTALERNLLRANGNNIPIEVTAQMFNDGRVMAIIRNISERKNTEEALKRSEEKYRSLVEQQADAITIFNASGKILDVNTSAMQMLKYTREELQNMTLTDILLEEGAANNPVSFTSLKEGAATIKQRKMRRKDGGLVETEVNAKHLGDGLFIASARDLTERIEVQREVEKGNELLDSIINSMPGLFYLFKKDGGYLRWNKQLELITGYSPEEISRISPLDFFSNEEIPLIVKAIEKTFENGSWKLEANLLTKDGRKIPYYFTGALINYADTECLLGMGIDLSAIKNLEKELSQQRIAVQKKIMQAMIDAEEKEKGKLGLELHDNISQILSVVRMYLTILDSSHVPEGVTLSRTIQLLDTAINEIRDLSHSLAISYKFEVGLTEALQEMIDKIRLTRGFSIDLILHPALNERTNSHQKLALYRIVQEQLNNIIKYAKASEVAVHIDVTHDKVHLKISDNGEGFNPLKVDKGLGLNNITNRVEALEGKVTIQSAPGKGCVVTVNLPTQTRKE